MADYYPLIAKAVEGLEKSTGEARRGLYDRARKALLREKLVRRASSLLQGLRRVPMGGASMLML